MERIALPDIPVEIPDASSTLRSGHVAAQYGRGNIHADRSSGIWYKACAQAKPGTAVELQL